MDNAINVSVRIKNDGDVVKVNGNNIIVNTGARKSISRSTTSPRSQNQYAFDTIFGVDASNEDIFDKIGKPVISNTENGYNSCIMAYGQTGCFGAGTLIPIYSTNMVVYKKVEDLCANDKLIGDDYLPRHIVRFYSGDEQMYEICDPNTNNTFVVNASHVLIFKVYYAFVNNNVVYYYNPYTYTYERRTSDLVSIHFEITMTVKEYLQISDVYKPYYKLFYVTSATNGLEKMYKYIYDICIQYGKYSYNHYKINAPTETLTTLLNTARILGIKIYLDITKHHICRKRIIARLFIERIIKLFPDTIRYKPYSYVPTIRKTYFGKYYGFELSGNNRFIGNYGDVLHNSGKTYTMEALTSNVCLQLVANSANAEFLVTYVEIYAEQIRDLQPNTQKLTVKQHKKIGTYIENVIMTPISSLEQLQDIITAGNKVRAVAATEMNKNSSRSHSILTLYATRGTLASKIHFVDLAGSEKANMSGATNKKFEEMVNINKSLSCLGNVILTLSRAQKASTASTASTANGASASKQQSNDFIFRGSVLTWLLKDCFGGNSMTYLIAMISSAFSNYNDTINTLQYVSTAKTIVNTVKVNDTNVVADLQNEIADLRKQLASTSDRTKTTSIQAEIDQATYLINKSWLQKFAESEMAWKTELDQARNHQAQMQALTQKIEEQMRQQVNSDIERLNAENAKLKNDLLEKEIKMQEDLRKFIHERGLLAKQIQQLKAQTLIGVDGVYAANTQKLADDHDLLTKKIAIDTQELERINIKHQELLVSVEISQNKLEELKSEYSDIHTKLNNDKIEYNMLIVQKEKLQTEVVALQSMLSDTIHDISENLNNPTDIDMQQLLNGFNKILDSIKQNQ